MLDNTEGQVADNGAGQTQAPPATPQVLKVGDKEYSPEEVEGLVTLRSNLNKTIGKKDAEIGKKDAEINALKSRLAKVENTDPYSLETPQTQMAVNGEWTSKLSALERDVVSMRVEKIVSSASAKYPYADGELIGAKINASIATGDIPSAEDIETWTKQSHNKNKSLAEKTAIELIKAKEDAATRGTVGLPSTTPVSDLNGGNFFARKKDETLTQWKNRTREGAIKMLQS